MKKNIAGARQVNLTVKNTRTVAPGIKQITLAHGNGNGNGNGGNGGGGGGLPGFDAGAHIRIDVPGVGPREYSLVNLLPGRDTQTGVETYDLGVRLEDESTGGSAFMHALALGDRVNCTAPQNDFPLPGEHENPLLIAGGIGITPIASMVADLAGRGGAFELHYAGRAQGTLAFLPQLQAIAGDRLRIHYDGTGTALDLVRLLGGASPRRHVYVCGPKGMIAATRRAAEQAGFAGDHLHSELFARAVPQSGDMAFEVEIATTGAVHVIPPGQSIIEVLEAAGVDLMYDCQRGDCGICQTDVVSGTPDHRDVVLSDEEKAAGDIMQICVSRAKSSRLVLDI